MILKRTPAINGFLCLCMLVMIVYIPRAWAMRQLWFDSHVRSQTQHALEQLAKERGWLLSDLDLTSVNAEQLRVIYQPHSRTSQNSTCLMIDLETFAQNPCPGE